MIFFVILLIVCVLVFCEEYNKDLSRIMRIYQFFLAFRYLWVCAIFYSFMLSSVLSTYTLYTIVGNDLPSLAYKYVGVCFGLSTIAITITVFMFLNQAAFNLERTPKKRAVKK